MNDNPYAPGAADPFSDGPNPPFTGKVDLVAAIRDGTLHAIRGGPYILGGLFLTFVLYLVSVCTCVGWIGLAPFMLHGLNRFMLSVVDNRPDFGSFTDGFQNKPGSVFLSGWGVLLLLVLILSPSMGVAFAVQFATQSGKVSATAGTVITLISGLGWSAAIAPLLYGTYVWADRGLGTIESFTTSFEAFRPSWLQLIGLQVLSQVLFAPMSFLGPYLEAQGAAMESLPPEEALSGLGGLLGTVGVLYGFMALLTAVTMCWTLTAYRQVFAAPEA
jgi:hypothetical protein